MTKLNIYLCNANNWYSSCVHRVAAECQEFVAATVVNVHRPLAPACL